MNIGAGQSIQMLQTCMHKFLADFEPSLQIYQHKQKMLCFLTNSQYSKMFTPCMHIFLCNVLPKLLTL